MAAAARIGSYRTVSDVARISREIVGAFLLYACTELEFFLRSFSVLAEVLLLLSLVAAYIHAHSNAALARRQR